MSLRGFGSCCRASPSPGTRTATQPAGDHRYTLLVPVHTARRGWQGSHWKHWIVHSCSNTTDSFSFRMSQIHTALGMLSGEEAAIVG